MKLRSPLKCTSVHDWIHIASYWIRNIRTLFTAAAPQKSTKSRLSATSLGLFCRTIELYGQFYLQGLGHRDKRDMKQIEPEMVYDGP